ncbi:hypothetical protein QFZ24_008697 [Streptomyces phaeochromogenes]|nr:hypothetical protein [Streptomyces phaeochromogenes]
MPRERPVQANPEHRHYPTSGNSTSTGTGGSAFASRSARRAFSPPQCRQPRPQVRQLLPRTGQPMLDPAPLRAVRRAHRVNRHPTVRQPDPPILGRHQVCQNIHARLQQHPVLLQRRHPILRQSAEQAREPLLAAQLRHLVSPHMWSVRAIRACRTVPIGRETCGQAGRPRQSRSAVAAHARRAPAAAARQALLTTPTEATDSTPDRPASPETEEGNVISRYIIWRNKHTVDSHLRTIVTRVNVGRH